MILDSLDVLFKRRIGLLGCGQWGQRILANLLVLKAEVVVYDPDAERRQWAMSNGAVATDDEWKPEHQCDGFVVATPASTHRAVLAKLAPAGKPIFVEKPLTVSYADARAIADLPLPPTFVMHIWRYHPGIRLLGELGRSGRLGELTLLKTTRTNWTSPRTDTDSVWTLAPHDLTIALEILGYLPQPRAAVTEQHGAASRSMTALLGNRPAVVFDVSTRYADKRREVRLHGTQGVAVLASETVDYVECWWGNDTSRPDEVVAERIYFESTPPLQLELAAFLAYLNGGPEPISGVSEGIKIVQIIDELLALSR